MREGNHLTLRRWLSRRADRNKHAHLFCCAAARDSPKPAAGPCDAGSVVETSG